MKQGSLESEDDKAKNLDRQAHDTAQHISSFLLRDLERQPTVIYSPPDSLHNYLSTPVAKAQELLSWFVLLQAQRTRCG